MADNVVEDPDPVPEPPSAPEPVPEPAKPQDEPSAPDLVPETLEPPVAAPKRRGRPPGSKNKPKPPKTVPAEEAVAAPSPVPAHAPTALRMTPAQERALRYMQRQDRYMELLARNTHEL